MAPKQAEEAKDYTKYIDKEPTPTQARCIEWLKSDEVGYNPATAKTKAEAFEMGAKLVFALRMEFQRSDFNQAVLAEAKQEKEAAATAPKPTRKPRAKAKAAPVEEIEEDEEELDEEIEDEEEVEEEPEPAPKPAPKRRAATRASAKTSTAAPTKPAPRRARAKAAGPAPF